MNNSSVNGYTVNGDIKRRSPSSLATRELLHGRMTQGRDVTFWFALEVSGRN